MLNTTKPRQRLLSPYKTLQLGKVSGFLRTPHLCPIPRLTQQLYRAPDDCFWAPSAQKCRPSARTTCTLPTRRAVSEPEDALWYSLILTNQYLPTYIFGTKPSAMESPGTTKNEKRPKHLDPGCKSLRRRPRHRRP